MVEGTPLLRVHPVKNWIQGSNPCVSAKNKRKPLIRTKNDQGLFHFPSIFPSNGPGSCAPCPVGLRDEAANLTSSSARTVEVREAIPKTSMNCSQESSNELLLFQLSSKLEVVFQLSSKLEDELLQVSSLCRSVP